MKKQHILPKTHENQYIFTVQVGAPTREVLHTYKHSKSKKCIIIKKLSWGIFYIMSRSGDIGWSVVTSWTGGG